MDIHNLAPKFSRIEIYLKNDKDIKQLLTEISDKNPNKPIKPINSDVLSNIKIFDDCSMIITGSHMTIIEDGLLDSSGKSYSKGYVFSLNDIDYYKFYKN